ncbi:hypothetical protein KC871_01070 [Candidatus Saccharibacteria bacterium]|nr:hypothetical protein [Candidatus Saccharibacteria bacterium]HPD99462.1 hypothetical protein [Candidatus Saccharibacteria bacterium]
MKYSICVSGAAAGKTVEQSKYAAEKVGRAIAKSGHIITTGATVGLPFYAARAAHRAHGASIGFSPATSLREHVMKYRLPIGMFDFINFTGLNYVGRDTYMVQSSDAVITIGGRFGSLHEFATAIENGTPCGVLTGTGGTADVLPDLIEKLEVPHKSSIIFDSDPESLVRRMIEKLDVEIGEIDTSAIANEWFLHGDEEVTKRAG